MVIQHSASENYERKCTTASMSDWELPMSNYPGRVEAGPYPGFLPGRLILILLPIGGELMCAGCAAALGVASGDCFRL